MEKFALLARVEAKPGKEAEVLAFLKSALPLAEGEPGTIRWYALQLSPSTFGIFDTFETEEDRIEHLKGKIAEALMADGIPTARGKTRWYPATIKAVAGSDHAAAL